MIHQTYSARKSRKHPPAATKWAHPLLLYAVCRERIPFVHTQGVTAALSAFLSLVTLTFDPQIQTGARFLYNALNRQVSSSYV